MPLPIVKKSDFNLEPYKLKIPDSIELSFEDGIRNSVQEYWIKIFLGEELGNAYIADLDSAGVPQDPVFTKIHEEVVFEDCHEIYKFLGIKRLTTQALYYLFLEDQPVINTDKGSETTQSVAGSDVSQIKLATVWNELVEQNRVLCRFLIDRRDDYEGYRFTNLDMATWI